jgi:hypothetical protein
MPAARDGRGEIAYQEGDRMLGVAVRVAIPIAASIHAPPRFPGRAYRSIELSDRRAGSIDELEKRTSPGGAVEARTVIP